MERRPLRLAIYSFERENHACGYLRFGTALAALGGRVSAEYGVQCRTILGHRLRSISLAPARNADLIVIQRLFPGPRTRHALSRLFALGKPVAYETDDLLVGLPPGHPLERKVDRHRPFLEGVMQRAAALTVTTDDLAAALSPWSRRIEILPNMVDESLWDTEPRPPVDGTVTFCFSGTHTHEADLGIIEDAVRATSLRYGPRVRFVFFGCATERIAAIPGTTVEPFLEDYRSHARRLQRSGATVGLVPLRGSAFNRCKSNIKWLEYGSLGIPGLFSAVRPYAACVAHERTGLLVPNEPAAWTSAMARVVEDPGLRESIAAAARETIRTEWSARTKAPLYLDAWRRISVARDAAGAHPLPADLAAGGQSRPHPG